MQVTDGAEPDPFNNCGSYLPSTPLFFILIKYL